MRWLVPLVVLAVACPGTPPGNFVRGASGELVKCGAALCAARAPRPTDDAAAATPAHALPPESPPAPLALVPRRAVFAVEGRPPSPSSAVAAPLGARAPPPLSART